MVALETLNIGDRARITGFAVTGSGYRRKLHALGFRPGVEISLLRLATQHLPHTVRMNGAVLNLRREEAAALMLEML